MTSLKPLKAIFFDIDNTLFPTTLFADQARINGLKAMMAHGLLGELDDLEKQLKEVVAEFGSNDSGHFKKLLDRLPKECHGEKNEAILEAAGIVGYSQTKYRHYKPHEDVIEVLKKLSTKNLVLGIVSNGRTLKQAEKLVRLGVLPYLNSNAIFISEQKGIAKPNPLAFQQIAKTFNLPLSNIMMVGDSPDKDIIPAKSLGLVCVQNCRNIPPEWRVSSADYHINNFWDLLEIVERDFLIS